ncbi:MAG: biotin synthase BioB, partial [Bacteroidetes bacterium]|nr:biotin synthase BioB [Bacteroidota bacterium]
DNRDFDNVLAMVREVNKLDMEVCCTLGMLSASQAEKLKEAGLTAYNHNIDTSEEYYDKVITTRTYEDRLETIHNVSKAGISVCSGGIIGLGEEEDARIGMIYTLANLPEPPESIPVNALVPVKGTPLENMERVSVWEMLRMIATIRIVVPKAMIRLSAGRNEMPISEQALCFIAGANSIFAGDKLLTTPNPAFTSDMEMFEILGLQPRVSFKNETQKEVAEVL